MKPREITVDLHNIDTPAALQVYLEYVLDVPRYYGHNLDSLYDVLTDIAQPLYMAVLLPKEPVPEMRAYLPRLICVMDDAAKVNPNFRWIAVRHCE